MRSAPARSLVIAAKAPSISWGFRAGRVCSRSPKTRAAASASRSWAELAGLSGCRRIATREAFGATSLRSSSSFPTRSGDTIVSPVTFPPGRARAATSPLPTGSLTRDMTIGIVLVACWTAWVAAPLTATMTSTLERTRSAARAG